MPVQCQHLYASKVKVSAACPVWANKRLVAQKLFSFVEFPSTLSHSINSTSGISPETAVNAIDMSVQMNITKACGK